MMRPLDVLRRQLLVLLSLTMPATLIAGLTPYSQNFDGLDIASPTALSGDGWEYFNIGSNGGGTYAYMGVAPNGPQISSVLEEFGGKHLNIYSDYNNTDAHPGPGGSPVIVNVQQIQFFDNTDLGTTWRFDFDYAAAVENGFDFSPTGATTTAAFVRVFDPGFGFLTGKEVDTTSAPNAPGFVSGSITQFIDPGWINGGFVQFGFTNTAANNENSGIYYDNLSFSQVPEPSSFVFIGLVSVAVIACQWKKRRAAETLGASNKLEEYSSTK